MGLDMYLNARRYISNYSHDPIGQQLARNVFKALNITNIDSYANSGISITLQAAYWRKANAEHQWFVNNVQDGVDNCSEYYVSRHKLSELIELCRSIIDNKETPEALPPTAGFFFGSTDIDDWYYADLQDTVRQLTAALNNPDFNECEFYYQSSW